MAKYGLQNTPKEVMILMASRIKSIRKEKKITQQKLAKYSGVAYATIRKFESTGIIALESLLKISNTLDRLDEFETILLPIGNQNKRLR